MAVKKDLNIEDDDAFSIQFHFTVGGEDFDITEDVFEAPIRSRSDLGSPVLRNLGQTVIPLEGRLTLGLTATQVAALPSLSWWRLIRYIGGDPERRQTIFEGRVRHG